MDAFKLPSFNSAIDGKLSQAVDIIANIKASENFTLDEWPGKELFENSCLTQFTDFREVLNSEIDLLSNDISDGENMIRNYIKMRPESSPYTGLGIDPLLIDMVNKDLDNIFEALNEIVSTGKLNYGIMVRVYMEISRAFDLIRGVNITNSYVSDWIVGHSSPKENGEILFSGRRVFGGSPPMDKYDIIRKMIGTSKNLPGVVPIVGITGLYGFNTFNYLFLNDYFPFGFGSKPYTAHSTALGSLDWSIAHDIGHYTFISKDTGHFRVRIRNEKGSPLLEDFISRSGHIYPQIFLSYDVIGKDIAEGLIFLTFLMIHEAVSFTGKLDEGTYCDYWPFLSKQPRYSPAAVGMDKSIIENMCNMGILTTSHQELSEYISRSMKKIQSDYINFCTDVIKVPVPESILKLNL